MIIVLIIRLTRKVIDSNTELQEAQKNLTNVSSERVEVLKRMEIEKEQKNEMARR